MSGWPSCRLLGGLEAYVVAVDGSTCEDVHHGCFGDAGEVLGRDCRLDGVCRGTGRTRIFIKLRDLLPVRRRGDEDDGLLAVRIAAAAGYELVRDGSGFGNLE